MSKTDSTLVIDKQPQLTRRRFLQLATAGSALAATVIPNAASAARVIYRHRWHDASGEEHYEAPVKYEGFLQRQAEQRHAVHPSPLSALKQRQRSRDLTLYVESSGEKLAFTYYERGQYLADALHEVNHLLRDQRNGDIHRIDPELLDQLYQLKNSLSINKKPFHVLSAYRSPETNARLHRHTRGVASKSLHMSGKAIDIRIEGIKTRSIRDAALHLAQGGVGYYPHSNFVHIDTGNFRTW